MWIRKRVPLVKEREPPSWAQSQAMPRQKEALHAKGLRPASQVNVLLPSGSGSATREPAPNPSIIKAEHLLMFEPDCCVFRPLEGDTNAALDGVWYCYGLDVIGLQMSVPTHLLHTALYRLDLVIKVWLSHGMHLCDCFTHVCTCTHTHGHL